MFGYEKISKLCLSNWIDGTKPFFYVNYLYYTLRVVICGHLFKNYVYVNFMMLCKRSSLVDRS